ncbi:hypothetical protein SHKM778_84500 [Streptomyces sp. KM77-8]|uniref:Glycosyltransferase 2-like domain-containing protein n=1 Tax=Streptomyces haneummycinicus TaxID=3074435 RepID=A0AAT9HX34_9ACTN
MARSLAARDPRIRYLRLPENSGGCSAPCNRALEIARAPYLMFLDSDDELPPESVASLLAAHRERDLDFAMGAVRRIRVDTGRRSTWMPHLVRERRTLDGVEADPRLFFEHLATSKMYSRAFLDRHDLRFPEGIHYEDQLFSAQAYCLAKRFTIIPEPVYHWYIAPYAGSDAASISNQRHLLTNVGDRVHVQRLIDAFLAESGHGALREDKDHKFLKHDFRMYAGDLPYRDEEWLAAFADLVNPYLETLSPGAYTRLPAPSGWCCNCSATGGSPRCGGRRAGSGTVSPRGAGHGPGRPYVLGRTGPRVGDGPRRTGPDRAGTGHPPVPRRPVPPRDHRDRAGPRRLGRPDGTHLRPGPAPPGRPAAREPAPHPRQAPPHGPVPALPGAPRRLRGPGPPRPGGRPPPADRLRRTTPPDAPPDLPGPQQHLPAPGPLAFPPLTARLPHHHLTIEPEGHTPGRLQLHWHPTNPLHHLATPASAEQPARRQASSAPSPS